MAIANTVQGDLSVEGILYCRSFAPPAGSITNAAVVAAAGIAATKLEHQHEITYGQPGGAISFTERQVIHVAKGAGTLLNFRAGIRTVCVGAATITVDLLKNGTTMLTAVITLDSGNAAYVVEAAALSVTTFAAGDVLEVNVVATAGGGTIGSGMFANMVVTEAAV